MQGWIWICFASHSASMSTCKSMNQQISQHAHTDVKCLSSMVKTELTPPGRHQEIRAASPKWVWAEKCKLGWYRLYFYNGPTRSLNVNKYSWLSLDIAWASCRSQANVSGTVWACLMFPQPRPVVNRRLGTICLFMIPGLVMPDLQYISCLIEAL